MMILLVSCSSNPKKPRPEPVSVPKGQNVPEVEALTDTGANSSPALSADGQRLLFVSREREAHRHGQVYEMNLSSQKERRLSFHDGDDFSPRYHPQGSWFAYASSTDELKEDPPLLRKKPALSSAEPSQAEPPTEIYLSRMDGSDIRRLTRRPGFDGHLRFLGKSDLISYSRLGPKGQWDSGVMNLQGAPVRRALPEPGSWSTAVVHPTRATLWAGLKEISTETNELWLFTKGNTRVRVAPEWKARFLNPEFHPAEERVVFAANYPDPLNFELYSVRWDGSCLTRFTFEPAQDLEPTISPEGLTLYFSSDRSGSSQIYRMAWPAIETCP